MMINNEHGIQDIEGLKSGFKNLLARSYMSDEKDIHGQYTNLMTACLYTGYVNAWRDREMIEMKKQINHIEGMLLPFRSMTHWVFTKNIILNLKTGERKHVSQDYEITDEEAEVLDLEYKGKVIKIIDHLGGLEQAEKAVLNWSSDIAIDDEFLTQDDVMEAIYGYKLTGLDNPFNLTIPQIEHQIEKLEKTISTMGGLGEDSPFAFAYASINLTHKISGREIDYDLRDLTHILTALRVKNSTAKSITE